MSKMFARPYSIRSHILLIVLLAAVLPLALVGIWLARTSVRSGEKLLREHLVASVDRFAEMTNDRWGRVHGELLWVTGNESVTGMLARGRMTVADSQFLNELSLDVKESIVDISILGENGEPIWNSPSRVVRRGGLNMPLSLRLVKIEQPVVTPDGDSVGTASANVRLAAIIPADSGRPLVHGSRVAIRGTTGGNDVLVALDPSMGFPASERITIDGHVWLVAMRRLDTGHSGPPLEIAVASPLSSYTQPFTNAGNVGFIALMLVVLLSLFFTFFLSSRLAGPLMEMDAAANSVARGNLERRVHATGPSELYRLADTFNLMTDSLRGTLDELTRRNSLAAVGEFATSLSHDVRNALTSVKLHMQRAAKRPVTDPVSHDLILRALNDVSRLDAAVTGALKVARSGQVVLEEVELQRAVRTAADSAGGAFAAVPATLDLDLPSDPIMVRGEYASLQQLFANLLFNAGQAVQSGGATRVSMERNDGYVIVSVADNGAGMNAEEIANLEKPYYSTRAEGTGLGLPIARRIAAAHGGEIRISSASGSGTTIEVKLPVLVARI